MQRNEHRKTPRGLADLLLPYALIEDGILLQQDGSSGRLVLSRPGHDGSLRFRDGCSEREVQSVPASGQRLDGALRCDSVAGSGLPRARRVSDPVTRVIDDERREQFMAGGAHFESEYFLTLTYLPPVEAEERAKGWLFEGGSARAATQTAEQILERFRNRVDNFENIFGALFQIEPFGAVTVTDDYGFTQTYDTLLRYYARSITGNDHPFASRLPLLSERGACRSGFHRRYRAPNREQAHSCDRCGRVSKMSSPGILRELDSLPIEYRWSTRAILIDPEEARSMLDMHRKKWRSKVRGWKDQILRTQSGAVNIHAKLMADDAEEAMSVAASGDVQFCLYSAVIICLDEDVDRLYESTRTVMKTVQNLGFTCRVETVNAIEAWRGSLPGDGCQNVRRVMLPHVEFGGHAADHVSLGGSAAQSIGPDAEEQPATAVCRDKRSDSIPREPPCLGPRTHAHRWTVRRWQINIVESDRSAVVPV